MPSLLIGCDRCSASSLWCPVTSGLVWGRQCQCLRDGVGFAPILSSADASRWKKASVQLGEGKRTCLTVCFPYRLGGVASTVQTGCQRGEEAEGDAFLLQNYVKKKYKLYNSALSFPQQRRASDVSISPPGSSISSPSRAICVSDAHAAQSDASV